MDILSIILVSFISIFIFLTFDILIIHNLMESCDIGNSDNYLNIIR